MARQKSAPSGYNFLLAAGEIDYFPTDKKTENVRTCGKELLRIASMNGSYENLPEDFRADMQIVAETSCDEEAAKRLGEIGTMLLSLRTLSEDERASLRAHCSKLSRYWPLRPDVLI